MKAQANQYKQVDVQTAIDAASPHQLIDMLFQGAIDRVAQAKGFMSHGDMAGKARSVNACIDIVEGLQASLDHNQGGDIAANLDALYEYMQRRLFRANADNDPNALVEVTDLLQTLREAWLAITPADDA
ncbi:MAG: flagellar export chaperone FliS [Pseudomonadota bacterium]